MSSAAVTTAAAAAVAAPVYLENEVTTPRSTDGIARVKKEYAHGRAREMER